MHRLSASSRCIAKHKHALSTPGKALYYPSATSILCLRESPAVHTGRRTEHTAPETPIKDVEETSLTRPSEAPNTSSDSPPNPPATDPSKTRPTADPSDAPSNPNFLRETPPHRHRSFPYKDRLDFQRSPPRRYGPNFIAHVVNRRRVLDEVQARGPRTRNLKVMQVKDVLVSSANGMLASGGMTRDGGTAMYDFETVTRHVTDWKLWEEGLAVYGCTPTDLLRWRNALACQTASESVLHLYPAIKGHQEFFYGRQTTLCPPPGWLLHLIALYRVHTPLDVAMNLRIAISTLNNPNVYLLERWKLGIIVLRQICAGNFLPMLHDCVSLVLTYPLARPLSEDFKVVGEEIQIADEEEWEGEWTGDDETFKAMIEERAHWVGEHPKALFTQMKFFMIFEAMRQLPPSPVVTQELLRVLDRHEEAGLPLTRYLLNWAAFGGPAHMTVEFVACLVRRMKQDGVKPTLRTMQFFLEVLSKVGRRESAEPLLNSIIDRVIGHDSSEDLTAEERMKRLKSLGEQEWGEVSNSLAAYVDTVGKRNDEGALELINDLKANTPDWDKRSQIWRAVLGTLGRSKSVSVQRLAGYPGRTFDGFREIRDPSIPPPADMSDAYLGMSGIDVTAMPEVPETVEVVRVNPAALVTIMTRLLDRRYGKAAIWLWRQVKRQLEGFDQHVLSILIRALNRVKHHDLSFGLICKAADMPIHPDVAQRIEYLWPAQKTKKLLLDDTVFNSLMDDLKWEGRFDVVWQLWNSMEPHFGVKPTGWTLTVLIVAANYSDVLPSFGSEFAELRTHLPFSRARAASIVAPAEIANSLAMKERLFDMWDGQPPYRVAQHIFKDVLFENFPLLKHVESPVSDKRNAFEFFPKHTGKNHEVWSKKSTANLDPGTAFRHLQLESDLPTMPRWPHIHPDQFAFGAYISLLGRRALLQEIPLVLAWMRALNIKPHRRTLIMALMFYEDAGTPPPMINRIINQHGGSYGKLKEWIEDWLGPQATPTEREIVQRRQVHFMGGWQKDKSARDEFEPGIPHKAHGAELGEQGERLHSDDSVDRADHSHKSKEARDAQTRNIRANSPFSWPLKK